MKKLIIFTCLFAALSATASNPPEVSEKVLKAFSETFMKATDVVWHEVKNFMKQVLNNPKLYQEQFMIKMETCLEQPVIIHKKIFRSIF